MKKVTPEKYIKPSKFIHFKVGENRIKIMSMIYLYQKYGLRAAGRYISQIVREGEPVNDIFLRKDRSGKTVEPKQQWGFVVWSDELQEFRVLECGPMLGDQLAKLLGQIGEDYKKVDILVNRVGLTMHDTKYTVKVAPENKDLPKRVGDSLKLEYEFYKAYFEKGGENANPVPRQATD